MIQRRCVRAARNLVRGTLLTHADLEVLRPAPEGSIPPSEIGDLIGRTLLRDLAAGEQLTQAVLGD